MTNRMLLFSKALCHSGWLLESLQSSRIHRPVFVCGKETPAFFFQQKETLWGRGKHCCPRHFCWIWSLILCFLEAGEVCCVYTASPKPWVDQPSVPNIKRTQDSQEWAFVLLLHLFMRLFPSICHSFALSVNAGNVFFLSYVISTSSQTLSQS